jgi:prevent-host-death family protein
MQVPLSVAKRQLTDLVRRAEAGEDVILTRHGEQVVRLVPVTQPQTPDHRRAVIARVQASAAAKLMPGPSAARSQDFLYDDDGLPG